MPSVRVRFAPSPTGFFHIGSARTALFNWLYARKTGGAFVLRIEDTDAQRNTDEALEVLLNGMKWLGMDWDEGPEKEGEYGPYFQSQRKAIYDKHLQILRDKGFAYDHEGAVFFRVSGKPQVIEDKVRGRVERTEEKDFVIYRSDGSPVFHFVNVVDDMTMGITHVIRGEDHLSNTSKHCELFAAFGVDAPVFAHIPLILKQSGPGKMSKRDTGALIEEYQNKQFLPAAVRNYLCLLGWNPKDDREVMELNEIIEAFDFEGIQRGGAKFDERKMAYINAEHLRRLPLETFTWMASPILASAGLFAEEPHENYLNRVMAMAQPKVNTLESLPGYIGYCFQEDFGRDENTLTKIRKKGDVGEKLDQLESTLRQVEIWDAEHLEEAFQNLAVQNGQEKPFAWFPTLRWAVSGTGGGPDLLPLIELLGKTRVLDRLKKARGILANAAH